MNPKQQPKEWHVGDVWRDGLGRTVTVLAVDPARKAKGLCLHYHAFKRIGEMYPEATRYFDLFVTVSNDWTMMLGNFEESEVLIPVLPE